MSRAHALSAILTVAALAGACSAGGGRVDTVRITDTVRVASTDSLSGSRANCQWWGSTAEARLPRARREYHLKCVIGGVTVRVDTSGVGTNGDE
jgi:hypothetical protein